jgi:hypothetical protein
LVEAFLSLDEAPQRVFGNAGVTPPQSFGITRLGSARELLRIPLVLGPGALL